MFFLGFDLSHQRFCWLFSPFFSIFTILLMRRDNRCVIIKLTRYFRTFQIVKFNLSFSLHQIIYTILTPIFFFLRESAQLFFGIFIKISSRFFALFVSICFLCVWFFFYFFFGISPLFFLKNCFVWVLRCVLASPNLAKNTSKTPPKHHPTPCTPDQRPDKCVDPAIFPKRCSCWCLGVFWVR